MNPKKTAVFVMVMVLSVASVQSAAAMTVFSDNFASDNFAAWSHISLTSGSTQTVSDGVARFIVPTPQGGNCTNSFVVKDGFTSTPNSGIVATQDIYVTKVPHGSSQGNGAIFFLYVCDSNDYGGNLGNFGVGIDGSGVWSLWIGGMYVYTYLFQTQGALPASNTWYRVGLVIDNPAKTVVLTVNGVAVISASQQQFTDKPHPVSLMVGMGENWWSDGTGGLEIDVDNVELFISDGSPSPPATQTPQPTNPPYQAPAQTTSTPKPSATPSPKPQPTPNPTSTVLQATTQNGANLKLTVHGNVKNAEISNLSVTNRQEASQTTVSFILTWQGITLNSANITIPKSAVQFGESPILFIDGEAASNQGYSQDRDNYYVWWLMQVGQNISVVFQAGDQTMAHEPPIWAYVLVAAVLGTAVVLKLKNGKKTEK